MRFVPIAFVTAFVPLTALVSESVPQRATGLLIRGGELYDGTGVPARRADIRTEGDVIAAVAPILEPRQGERVIDAAGLSVAPGFIDSHSHVAGGLQRDPGAGAHVRQGITTAIVGQDGASDLPVAETVEDVERTPPAINVATLVGHGTVRRVVMGADFRRAATSSEIEVMKTLVDRAMRDGAIGLSSGLEYDPGFYARPDELAALARVAAAYGGYYASHVRDEEHEVFAAWQEAIEVGRLAGLPVVISHAKGRQTRMGPQRRLGECPRAGAAKRRSRARRLVPVHVLAVGDLRPDSRPRLRESGEVASRP
ncbi:MAG: amidohydrolase family protein [Vicinamibacterales bacterium]